MAFRESGEEWEVDGFSAQRWRFTYKILTDETKKIIFHSAIRPRGDKDPNNHLDIFGGVEADKPIKSVNKSKEYALPDVRTITFSPDDLVGRTFLKQPEEDGQCFQARIVP